VRIGCGDYERPQQLLDEVDVEDEATSWLALRCQLIRGALAQRTERIADAERYLLDARQRAEELGASHSRARSEFELANLLASHGRPDEAAAYVSSALEAYATMGQPDIEVEALALGARLLASLGDAPGARARAERAAARCKETRLQSYSEVAWNLAATYALIGDDSVADAYARAAAAAAVDDALRMPADLAASATGPDSSTSRSAATGSAPSPASKTASSPGSGHRNRSWARPDPRHPKKANQCLIAATTAREVMEINLRGGGQSHIGAY
jgi:tetratricopeptide (TPR) repeat protein